MSNTAVLTALVTVLLAVLGYLATYLNNVRLGQRQARLDRVNRQLSELYGPMLAILGANARAFEHFSEDYDFSYGLFRGGPPTEEDHKQWRRWVTTVFAAQNERLHEIILTKSDLLVDDHMPSSLLDFCSHVLGYKVVMLEWEEGDYTM